MDYSRFDNIGGTDSDSNSDCGCGLPKGRSEGDDADYDPYPEDPSYQRWLAFQNAKNGLVLRRGVCLPPGIQGGAPVKFKGC